MVPRIGDMDAMAATLKDLVPDLGVIAVHGKLPAAEIDEAMVASISSLDGQMFLRNTSLPSESWPSGWVSKSKSMVPAMA